MAIIQKAIRLTIAGFLAVLIIAIYGVQTLNTDVVEASVIIGIILIIFGAFEFGFYIGASQCRGVSDKSVYRNKNTLKKSSTSQTASQPEPESAESLIAKNRPSVLTVEPSTELLSKQPTSRKPALTRTTDTQARSGLKPVIRTGFKKAKQKGPNHKFHTFIWRCDSSRFTPEEKAHVEYAGDKLNDFVLGKKTTDDFHTLLENILSGDIEATTPAQKAWEKYLVRCDVEQSRHEVIIPEGFPGSREEIYQMRLDRSRARFYSDS